MSGNDRQAADHIGTQEGIMSKESEEPDKKRYLRWMAESLVANLGYDQAVRACRDMCWYGTLEFLIAEKDGQFVHASDQHRGITQAA